MYANLLLGTWLGVLCVLPGEGSDALLAFLVAHVAGVGWGQFLSQIRLLRGPSNFREGI